MRDHLPTGEVAGIMKHHVEKMEELEPVYTNKHLASYSKEISDNLLSIKSSVAH